MVNNKAGLIFLLIMLVMLSACSNVSSEQQMREVDLPQKELPKEGFFPEPLKIVSLGDSLTQGVGDSTDLGGYVPLLETSLENRDGIGEVDILNYGKRGNRSDQLLKRVREENDLQTAIAASDVAIITIGGNDVMKVVKSTFPSLSFESFEGERLNYEENLTEILSEIRSINPEISVVLMGIYNPFFMFSADVKEMKMIVDTWNDSGESIISDYDNTSYVEVADLFRQTDQNLLHTDYFHPNDEGYSLIAKRIETGVIEVLDAGSSQGDE
ncbi:SGNH/GDSL hydrolase family protein [Jeotgalibacillus haloalkalitolerans]|uniref:SGNH/GDSL hydrolase family protein n=1 Tax=Jeotgalibacillus haloalkalitolerans TaxID=3104292 RepID=A0ABU5KLC9_9BACL|nr:SGNH/GDSL hydrolase family protein [Jeotgalibacillus sp. HH7-29]MDZ5711944.1 SGNH/GDSL hydrolase family protein [Jeotgalibacillus sp. HH7-29]